MHYTRQINKLGTAVDLIAPHAYEGNEVMAAIKHIIDIQDDIWGRYNPQPDIWTTFDRFKQRLARRRAITIAMMKEKSND